MYKEVLAVIIFLFLIMIAIVLFYLGDNEKNSTERFFIYVLGVIAIIIAIIVIISTILLSKCDKYKEIGDFDNYIKKMYKFSSSYIFNINQNDVTIPSRLLS
jgi:fumarate reductase subunit C